MNEEWVMNEGVYKVVPEKIGKDWVWVKYSYKITDRKELRKLSLWEIIRMSLDMWGWNK